MLFCFRWSSLIMEKSVVSWVTAQVLLFWVYLRDTLAFAIHFGARNKFRVSQLGSIICTTKLLTIRTKRRSSNLKSNISRTTRQETMIWIRKIYRQQSNLHRFVLQSHPTDKSDLQSRLVQRFDCLLRLGRKVFKNQLLIPLRTLFLTFS